MRGIVFALVLAGAAAATTAVADEKQDAFAALPALHAPHYTGGLTREDRAVAERIHTMLASRFPGRCGDGAIVVRRNDPDLAALVRALDSKSQEVADTAAYAIGLLGPSAAAASPILDERYPQDFRKGGWYNAAYARVACRYTAPPSARHTLSDVAAASLPRSIGEINSYGLDAEALVATLYLDRDIEYPPGLLIETVLRERGWSPKLSQLVVRILDDETLSLSKRLEADTVLRELDPEAADDARVQTLLDMTPAEALRDDVGTLVALHSPKAIPILATQLYEKDWNGEVPGMLCKYGHAAIAAEDRLIVAAKTWTWPRSTRAAVGALGCVGSSKALPMLIAMLRDQDWLLNESAANAIGAIGIARPDAIAALERANRDHWSALVRKAADEALFALHARPAPPPSPPPAPSSGPETLTIGLGPQPFNHGLPWCDPKGRYSIDGRRWFSVDWKEAAFEPVPKSFSNAAGMPQKGYGTRTFLPVPDGWLFGADGFEHEGLFLHVSNSGRITELDTGIEGHAFPELHEGQAVINTILHIGKKYLAFGYETLRGGDAGVLYEIVRDQSGHWRATRKLVLPGIAQLHAFAPDGTLLMSDTANTWAVAHGEVVPLQCSKTFEGSYFRDGVRQNYP